MTKKIVVPTLFTTTLLIAALLSIKVVTAHDTESYPPVVQKLAERFNLDEKEVQEVFQEAWDERHAERYAMFEQHLSDLVEEGRITEKQKQELLGMHEEMHDKLEGGGNITPEERYELMKQMHQDMNIWAEENNIDLSGIAPFGRGLHHNFGTGHMMRMH